MFTKRQQAFRWLVVALIAYVIVAQVAGIWIHGVLVERLHSENLVPYLVDVITIPKYLIIVDLGIALWFLFSSNRRIGYSLLLAALGLLFVNALFNVGKWYQEAQYVSLFEFNLLQQATLSSYVVLCILAPIGLLGLLKPKLF